MADEKQGPQTAADQPAARGVFIPPSPTLAAGTSGQRGAAAPVAETRQVEAFRVEQEAPELFDRARPVEVLLRDPLSEVARKERRSLLGVSAIAILIGSTGLIPEKIENLGIAFTKPERTALLRVFMAVVVYYALAFIIYAMNDFLSYLHAVHLGSQEIRRKQREDKGVMESMRSAVEPPDTPWRMIGFVSPVSVLRGIFDFVIPLAVAIIAVVALYSAMHPTIQPKTPLPPVKVAPQSR